jgi:uncharacterized protein
MHLAGKYVVNAIPSIVRKMLMDTETLAKIIPGISRLEKTGPNTFKSILEIKLGPVNSSFTGSLQLEEVTEQKGFMLNVLQNSRIGNANAAVRINLLPVDDKQTEVVFDGDVKLTGLLASMGQRVLGGVSNLLTNQFLTNLEKELEVTS